MNIIANNDAMDIENDAVMEARRQYFSVVARKAEM